MPLLFLRRTDLGHTYFIQLIQLYFAPQHMKDLLPVIVKPLAQVLIANRVNL